VKAEVHFMAACQVYKETLEIMNRPISLKLLIRTS